MPNDKDSDALETEWQFDASDLDKVAAWLTSQPASAALTFSLKKDVHQTDVYFDTEDWAIHRAGYGLRVRRGGDPGSVGAMKALGSLATLCP